MNPYWYLAAAWGAAIWFVGGLIYMGSDDAGCGKAEYEAEYCIY